jgi:outer membrane protein TolC
MLTAIMKKKIYPFLIFCLQLHTTYAQQVISLEDCYTKAYDNFPLIKQKELITKSSEYSLSNLEKGKWPQLVLNGQATLQSEVTRIPITIPGITINQPTRDQYKAYADIAQPLTELFTIKDQQELIRKNEEIQKLSLDAELYKLKDRINQLYFGILLLDEQLKLNALLDKDLNNGLSRTTAAIKNGVDYNTSLDKVKAELLKNKQRAIELKSQRKAFADMLGYFIHQDIDNETILTTPVLSTINPSNHRPEITLYDSKAGLYLLQEKLIKNRNIPKVSLFLQGGVGKPSPFNMFTNNIRPYAIGGLKASWSFINYYTQKNEKAQLLLEKQSNDVQKELFLFSTNLTNKQQYNELTKLQELLSTDDELVALRTSIKITADVQLSNGIITTTDYIKEVNAEDQARQQKVLHQIQFLIANYNVQNTLGN